MLLGSQAEFTTEPKQLKASSLSISQRTNQQTKAKQQLGPGRIPSSSDMDSGKLLRDQGLGHQSYLKGRQEESYGPDPLKSVC